MFIVISFMIAGIAIGYFFRKWKFRFIHTLILTLIWLLLFLLGLEVGSNETVVRQFATLGLEAFLLAFAGTMGSVIFAWILWKKPLQPPRRGGFVSKITHKLLIKKSPFGGFRGLV
jgi:uncharacterized membrane protein YbjE (DUF340 family)